MCCSRLNVIRPRRIVCHGKAVRHRELYRGKWCVNGGALNKAGGEGNWNVDGYCLSAYLERGGGGGQGRESGNSETRGDEGQWRG